MTSRLFTSAALAGLVAGALAFLLTTWLLVPLIVTAELFESGALTHFVTTANGAIETPVPTVDILAEPARHAGTFAMSLVTYVGFALLLAVGIALAERNAGLATDARRGLVWGLAGFVAVHLAPAAGLPPELPGTVAAELGARQAWWIVTVGASVAGIAMLAFVRGPLAVLGVALIAAPHLWGAPHLDTYFGVAPPELAATFAARSLAVAGASWAILGASLGWLWARAG